MSGVTVRYGPCPVLTGVTAAFGKGELVALLGPNGAGKSTLLRTAAGLMERFEGSCEVEGVEVRKWRRKELARRIAYLGPGVDLTFPYRAREIVAMGRAPYWTSRFEDGGSGWAVERSMEEADVSGLGDRFYGQLSAGERQRVLLATALAQEPEGLLLDEPTSHLDLEHQLGCFRLLRRQVEAGRLVVVVTHDLNLAAAFATRIVCLARGSVVADGEAGEVLDSGCLREVFRVDLDVVRDGSGQRRVVYG
jgi:iron complex transport system ATP-binding protein